MKTDRCLIIFSLLEKNFKTSTQNQQNYFPTSPGITIPCC